MNGGGRFEDRLLVELRRLVAERPGPAQAAAARRRFLPAARRRLVLVAGTAAAIACAAALVPLLTGGGTAAYAVTTSDDGTVTVEINSLSDAAGLQAKLRDAGVPAVVLYLPPGKACREPIFTPSSGQASGAPLGGGVRHEADGSTAFSIDPAGLQPGDTLVIMTQDVAGPDGGTGWSIGVAVAHGPVKTCDVVDAPAGAPPLAPAGAQPAGGTVTDTGPSLHTERGLTQK